jgi:hypothetical protein
VALGVFIAAVMSVATKPLGATVEYGVREGRPDATVRAGDQYPAGLDRQFARFLDQDVVNDGCVAVLNPTNAGLPWLHQTCNANRLIRHRPPVRINRSTYRPPSV